MPKRKSPRSPRERLDHFVRTVHRIEAEHELTGLSLSMNVHYDQATGTSSTLNEPEFHRLRSLLIAVRPYRSVP
jgi:hypothetical protein